MTHCLETYPAIQGLIKHGALQIAKGWMPDGYLICGDCFFLEVLLMLTPDLWTLRKEQGISDGS